MGNYLFPASDNTQDSRSVNDTRGTARKNKEKPQDEEKAKVPSTLEDIHLEDYALYVAIDFGTTESGFSFSFQHEDTIYQNKNWGQDLGFMSYKAPSSVLIDQTGAFDSFGYEAENKYMSLEKEDRQSFNLYRRFKMALQNKVSLKTKILSVTGKPRLAVDIFSMALKYLKLQALRDVNESLLESVDEGMIRWILTVPAIWNEEAKKFMREASFRAGLIDHNLSDKLVIALEPEAALLYSKKFYDKSAQAGLGSTLKTGTRCMVIDGGGGTIDIVTLEITDHRFHEVSPPTGGPHGGICVDQAFEKIMEEIISQDFVQTFKVDHANVWLKFIQDFVIKKKQIKTSGEMVAVKVPTVLYGELKKSNLINHELKDIKWSSGYLKISGQTFHRLYRQVIEDTMNHIKRVCSSIKNVNCVFLAGGFSQFEPFQNAVKEYFRCQDCEVFCPPDPQLTVLTGAIMFGKDPDAIQTRIAQASYGVAAMKIFNVKENGLEYLATDPENKHWCISLFKSLVVKGEQLKIGKEVLHKLGTNYDSSIDHYTDVEIFKTQKENVKYIYDYGVSKVGTLRVHHIMDRGCNVDIGKRKIAIKVEIGRTELKISASDTESEDWVDTQVEFICC